MVIDALLNAPDPAGGVTWPHRIASTVRREGAPAARVPVIALDRWTMRLLGSALSTDAGGFEISNLPPVDPSRDGGVLVLALDTTGAFNSLVADRLSRAP